MNKPITIQRLNHPTSAAPLATFRICFGWLMLYSHLRFWALGWMQDHFSGSSYYFKYFGFEWVEPLPLAYMHILNGLLVLAAFFISIGFQYRLWIVVHFFIFTYFQLCDLTYYLNHYYFVILVNLVLIFLPANALLAVDNCKKSLLFYFPVSGSVPLWAYLLPKVLICLVYFYAGLAKINYDWLIDALPLKIWLPAHYNMPMVGWILAFPATAYLFSWFGMLYDTLIPFFLWNTRTVKLAYFFVVVFHLATGLLFEIGIFPLVMIVMTFYFFPIEIHEKIVSYIANLLSLKTEPSKDLPFRINKLGVWLLLSFLFWQLIFPLRFLLYKGDLFWTEEGYRFSWRVMLMEKAGTATFYVKDSQTGKEGVVDNSQFLKPHQEKQMSMQPDMILQFAHFLANYYKKQGIENPSVRAEVYVTLNARPSRLLIDPEVDLTKIKEGWQQKTWILPYQ